MSALKNVFRKWGFQTLLIIVRRFGVKTQRLEEYAAMLWKRSLLQPSALGDMGTSRYCIVTIALEKLGIPSVYITAPRSELVEGVAFYGQAAFCRVN